jgi:integrase/recombinase XerD
MSQDSQIITVLNNQDLTKPIINVKSDLPDYWTREQVNNILDAIKDQSHRMLLTFLWMTGGRITEALSLRRSDLDFESYLIKIRWLKNRKYNYRQIPMHPDLRQLLSMFTSRQLADDLVFNISRQRAWQLTKKYANANPHKFRHSFAVNWLKCGGDIITLSKMLGHSDVKTTMVYLNIVPIDQGKELIKIQFR